MKSLQIAHASQQAQNTIQNAHDAHRSFILSQTQKEQENDDDKTNTQNENNQTDEQNTEKENNDKNEEQTLQKSISESAQLYCITMSKVTLDIIKNLFVSVIKKSDDDYKTKQAKSMLKLTRYKQKKLSLAEKIQEKIESDEKGKTINEIATAVVKKELVINNNKMKDIINNTIQKQIPNYNNNFHYHKRKANQNTTYQKQNKKHKPNTQNQNDQKQYVSHNQQQQQIQHHLHHFQTTRYNKTNRPKWTHGRGRGREYVRGHQSGRGPTHRIPHNPYIQNKKKFTTSNFPPNQGRGRGRSSFRGRGRGRQGGRGRGRF